MRKPLPELTKKSLNTAYQGEVSDFDALALIQYMEGLGIQDVNAETGYASCSLCGVTVTFGKKHDYVFEWDAGLPHAILHHCAKPPQEFIDHVRKMMDIRQFFHVLGEAG